jgi:hypothetical protein
MPVPLERRPLIAVSMMLMMGINLVSAQDTNSSNSSNAAGFFNCCKSAGLEILREEVRKIARARGLNYEPSRAVRVRRSRGTGISVNGTLKGFGVFNEEQRRTLELELPSQQQLGMFCLVDGHRFGPGNALPVGAPCKIWTPGGDRLGYIDLHKAIGSPLNQLAPRVGGTFGGTFQPAQPAQLPVPLVFVPPMHEVQQQVGYFCGVPGIGRFGPGPMNAIGAPCFVGPYQGSVTF